MLLLIYSTNHYNFFKRSSAWCMNIIVSSWHYFTFFSLILHSLTSLSHLSVVGVFQEDVETGTHLDPSLKELNYNPTYDTMFAPEVRSVHVFSLFKCLSKVVRAIMKIVFWVISWNENKMGCKHLADSRSCLSPQFGQYLDALCHTTAKTGKSEA